VTVAYQNDVEHEVFTLSPRVNGFLRLTDHEVTLSLCGVEEGKNMQLYMSERAAWVKVLWDSKIPITYEGQVFFLRYKTVSRPLNFDHVVAQYSFCNE